MIANWSTEKKKGGAKHSMCGVASMRCFYVNTQMPVFPISGRFGATTVRWIQRLKPHIPPNDTRVCRFSRVAACTKKKKEPDTQKHLLHLPHTWLSNQFATVKNTLAAFLHERRWRAKAVVSKVH